MTHVLNVDRSVDNIADMCNLWLTDHISLVRKFVSLMTAFKNRLVAYLYRFLNVLLRLVYVTRILRPGIHNVAFEY
jgi:hypothetical protein